MKLSLGSLDRLSTDIARPAYRRASLSAGILHIGVGNFHRAHQAWYLHRLMQEGRALDWAIVGAGVRPYDAQMRARLAEQDYLTTLIELSPGSVSAEVTGAMIDYVPVEEGQAPLIARMAEPDIRIVTLTVTEGGYYLDPATKQFDAAHEDMVHDAAHPDAPRTAFGAMVAALRRRRDSGIGPFTGLSCDNLQGNGSILRQTIVKLARLSDPDLAGWIAETCTFPNSMVDCIVPATGDKERAAAAALGIEDAAPVTHENFRQWVIEDSFCAGRPDWDRVGATFSARVHDYEAMKIRVLNGGHQVLANAGELLGVETIAGAMGDARVGGLHRKVQAAEIVPFVEPVPGMTAEAYLELISGRFANPAIIDTTRRVAFDGSSRHTGFVLPSIRAGLEAGKSVDGLALVEALWARYCLGTREDGSLVEPNDPHWDVLTTTAKDARSEPAAWLAMTQFYGELGDDERFARPFANWLTRLYRDGVATTLEAYLAG